MTSLFGGGGSNSSASEISGLTGNSQYQQQLASNVENQGNQVFGEAGQIYSPAYSQYVQGLTGQLSPSQQALVTENLGTMDTGTSATYGNMGLGGSTMEGQDLASNSLKSMAEQSNINFQNEAEGLSGLQTADQYYGTANSYNSTAANALSGVSNSLSSAGQLANSNNAQLNSAINSLGNKTSGGGGSGSSSGGLLSGLGSLFSSSGSGTGVGAVDSGIFDVAA